MTGNGTARWLAVAALMGSLACSSTTARPAETGAAPSDRTTANDNGNTGTDQTGNASARTTSDTNVAGGQGGTWDTTSSAGNSQDTSRTRAPRDTTNTGSRIHTDSASVSAPSNQAEPDPWAAQTDTTGQYRYLDTTGGSSTARDSAKGRTAAPDTSRTQSP
ncbi:MAG TPA: hypothetical protein VFS33_11890 [Gemmatimonadales bacterium]|nr:hypothetical protein [Gemmatimonadales bacterium]